MSSIKKYEAEIMRQYDLGMERTWIIENLAIEHKLTYEEAEPIVSTTILRNTGANKK